MNILHILFKNLMLCNAWFSRFWLRIQNWLWDRVHCELLYGLIDHLVFKYLFKMGDDLEMTLNNSKVSDECKAEAVTVDDSLWAEVKLYVAKFFKLEPGVVLAKGEGFYLPVPKILTYEPGLVRTVLAPYISSDITVCYSVYNWLHHLGYVAYAICLMLFLIAYGFTDNQPGAAGACSDSDPSRNRAMCQLNGVLLDAKTEFRFLIAFILSGYVGVSVSIWAKRRSNYASLCGCARNLNLVVASVLPIDSKNTELCELRKKLARWVMLAMELAMLKARGHMDSNEGRDYLINSGLALKNEWDAMVKGDRHTTVFWWIMNEFTTMGRAGKLDAPYVILVSETVGVMRAQANDLMSSLDRDKPYSYTALCGLLVRILLSMY